MKYPLMGKLVTVTHEYIRVNVDNGHNYEKVKLSTPRPGWFIGQRTIFSGTRDGDEFGTYFCMNDHYSCILVCYWPTQNAVRVPLHGFSVGGKRPEPDPGPRWSDKDKAILRDIVKSQPRDKHGRFVSEEQLREEKYGHSQ
jgi:hypothetical protein